MFENDVWRIAQACWSQQLPDSQAARRDVNCNFEEGLHCGVELRDRRRHTGKHWCTVYTAQCTVYTVEWSNVRLHSTRRMTALSIRACVKASGCLHICRLAHASAFRRISLPLSPYVRVCRSFSFSALYARVSLCFSPSLWRLHSCCSRSETKPTVTADVQHARVFANRNRTASFCTMQASLCLSVSFSFLARSKKRCCFCTRETRFREVDCFAHWSNEAETLPLREFQHCARDQFDKIRLGPIGISY